MRLHAAGLTPAGVALWVLCGLAGAAWATDNASPPSGAAPSASTGSQAAGALLDFDIPAQPLVAALKQYAAHSNRPTLFQGAMVAGRTSSAVRGRYPAEAALHLLLEGTGLVAQNVSGGPADALILKEVSAPATAARAGTPGVDTDYGAWVQARVWDALCADPRTAPGQYRSLLRFQVDASGQVQRARLLGTTGDARRDAAVLATLQRVRVDRAPPPDMAQPLTMIVLPRDPGSSSPQCAGEVS